MKIAFFMIGLFLAGATCVAGNVAGVDCTNFNGTWSGTCTVNSQSQSQSQSQSYQTMYLQKTCDYISDGNIGMAIGGKVTYTQETKAFYKALVITQNWDSPQQVLTFHTTIDVTRNSDGLKANIIKDGTLSRDGNKLLEHYVQDEVDRPKDGTSTQSQTTVDCILQPQTPTKKRAANL